jgi:DNA-binding LytR/AlgR family response regulator
LHDWGEAVRVAVCDDDVLELKKIEAAMLEFISSKQAEADITLNTFSSGIELLNYINNTASFDLIVLDILMPYMTGIEVATQLRKTNNDMKIIFLTTSPEFAVNSYKVNAFYYLLKPFQKQELISLLDKALVSMQSDSSSSIVVKGKAGLIRIPLHMIEYAESVKHTLNFHLRGGETASCYAKMGDYSEALLNDIQFVHCHQSFIVNMGRVAQITAKCFIMQDQTQIPISRTVYPQVKQAYIGYFFHKEKDF